MANIDVSNALSNVTMTFDITGLKRLRLRTWLGLRLISLAVRVLGCQADVVDRADKN